MNNSLLEKRWISSSSIFYSDNDRNRNWTVRPDVTDGLHLDVTRSIAREFKSGKAIDEYFHDKESSIRNTYREDSNTAAAEGASASELSSWMEARDELLAALKAQREDVYALTDYDSGGDTEEEDQRYDYDSQSSDEGSPMDMDEDSTNHPQEID